MKSVKKKSLPGETPELIAVITAAVAAFEGGTKANLTIRKINRISGPSPAWNNMGRIECIDSRRM